MERWKWSRPNARVYTMLIQGLAASLRVSDALSVVKYICEVGVSPSEEVWLKELSCFLVVRPSFCVKDVTEIGPVLTFENCCRFLLGR